MRRLAPGTLMLIASLLSTGCGTSTDEGRSLAAPTNFSVSYVSDPTYWHYTFAFTAVEFAENYLIYYSLTDDHSAATSLASGQFPPVTWIYSRANSYGGQPVYFWVRAYDGKNYGQWSSPISGFLE